MKSSTPRAKEKSRRFPPLLLLVAVLAALFWRSFLPGYVHFANDGPLGQQMAAFLQPPAALFGMWDDLNDTGFSGGTFPFNISFLLRWMMGPVGFEKFYSFSGILMLGLSAWTLFRALKFGPWIALIGAFATALNSTFFATACWGVAGQQIALAMDFFALALIVANTRETPWQLRWTRLALAGLCVGMNVVEAADIGAIYSLFIAAFVFFKTWNNDAGGSVKKAARSLCSVAVVAVFAGFIATQTIISLVGTSIQGIAGTAQDAESRAQHWDWATQWSLPKKETLGLVVPGLFGYKMDTPKDMMPVFQDAYRGGVYWGGIGRDPANDRFFDSGGQGSPPDPQWMRQTGGGDYCGILVVLIAAWGVAQSFRRQNSPFVGEEKKMIWFWLAVVVISLPLAWGRFAPGSETANGYLFYALLYKLPYFSTIRNPAKFVIFLSWAGVILFTYGLNAFSRRYLNGTARTSSGLSTQIRSWWAGANAFDRRWTWTCIVLFSASVIGWFIFYERQPDFVTHLQKVGFPDEDLARQIAAFSLSQLGWFIGLLAAAVILITMGISGYFSGARARIGTALLGAFLVFDLCRADLPYVVHWNYKQKYEVGSLNPILEILRQQPYEHRVVGLPVAPQGLELLNELYRIEWTQHLFPYYNIQCLDVIMMPRVAVDLKNYLQAFDPRGAPNGLQILARHWQLTNTRYVLGPAGYLEALNDQLDPGRHRFQLVRRFNIVLKPGVSEFHQRLEELTAVLSDQGDYGLFEFAGALPRAKLYGDWQVNTNGEAVLSALASMQFHPNQTVLVDTPEKDFAAVATNANSGKVEFKSYAPQKIVLAAESAAPSILLLNDRFDPAWRATVDGKPVELLRCNYIMRGVYLPPGPHTVKFDFRLPLGPVCVSISATIVGAVLFGLMLFFRRRGADSRVNT